MKFVSFIFFKKNELPILHISNPTTFSQKVMCGKIHLSCTYMPNTINVSPSLNLMVYVHGIFLNVQFQLIIHNIMLGMFSQACSYQIFMLPISSTFIDLNDYSNEDVFLHVSSNVNVCGSFFALGFKIVHFGGHAFEFESGSRFWNILLGAK